MFRESSDVSLVIRTRDVENRLSELLRRLSLQTLKPWEIVVVDNFSTKEKLENMKTLLLSCKKSMFSRGFPLKLAPVKDEEFSHAYSTNVGVSAAERDFVCITNGHSLPLSNDWLESAVKHFWNPRMAGVGGYSRPHRDGTFWEKITYRWLWKELRETSGAYITDTQFSTTNCLIKKAIWREYPFDEDLLNKVPGAEEFGGEDYDWLMEIQARGYSVVVEPRFSVFHSHREDLSQLLRKYLIWRQIRRRIKSFKRPRESYTKLAESKPSLSSI